MTGQAKAIPASMAKVANTTVNTVPPLSLAPRWERLPSQHTLLNVSYDPTRELYSEFNAAFAKLWKAKTGRDADVVTLALAGDVNALYKNGQWIAQD